MLQFVAEKQVDLMAAKKNIHQIDNLLLILGSIFLFLGLCMLAGVPVAGIFVMLGGVGMLVTGFVVRAKENRVIAVWDILERATEVSVPDLIHSTGYERPFLQEALHLINTRTSAYYVWDTKADRIVDGRLRTHVMVVEHCPSCGVRIGKTLSLDLSEGPSCPYCNTHFSGEQLNEMKAEVVERIRVEDELPQAKPKKRFKIHYFLPLLLLGWPFAIGYALWAYGVFGGKKTVDEAGVSME